MSGRITPLLTPIAAEDTERAIVLADFLTDKRWTIGEAKRAFALWYEQVGCPPEFGDVILSSDLIDFMKLTGMIRGTQL